MTEENNKGKYTMRIPLSSKYSLIGDRFQYWIVQEVKKQDGTTYDKRISGYCSDYENLLASSVRTLLGESGIETFNEFTAEMRRLERLIHKWCKEIGENNDKGR